MSPLTRSHKDMGSKPSLAKTWKDLDWLFIGVCIVCWFAGEMQYFSSVMPSTPLKIDFCLF